jgi:hypothetical protein
MCKARGAFGALLLRPCAMAIFGALAITLGLGSSLALGPYDDPQTAEGWAWPQIERSEMADFNERCGTPALDPKDESDARWRDDCRKLSAGFVQDLLTRAPWREAIPFAGVQIKGARIVGDIVDLENAKLIRSISILSSRIEGAINLIRARTDSLIWVEGSLMNGRFDASGLHSESDLWLKGGVFKSEVNLNGAKIDGSVVLTGAGFDGKLDAGQVQIGSYLLMNSLNQSKASFNEVDLTDAKVGGQFNLLGASFNGPLTASLLRVGGNLLAPSVGQYQTRFQSVFLLGAEIAGNVSLIGSNFDGPLRADLMQVGGNLAMSSENQKQASFKEVSLVGAKVAGHVMMTGARFDGALEAAFLRVAGNLAMSSENQTKASFKDVNLNGARITGKFDMTGASFKGKLNADSLEVGGDLSMQSDADNRTSFKDVNLNGAKIKGQLNLSGSSFDGALNAGTLHVDGNLLMQFAAQNKPSFKNVDLFGAKVAGNVSMIGASFDGTLTAGLLQVDGYLFMGSLPEHRATFKKVNLAGAKVAGNMYMLGASFDGALDAASLQVGGDLLMRDADYADKVDMFFAHIGRNLDLRGASLGDLDLSGASIAAALQLGGVHESAAWKGKHGKSGALNLRNAHAGNLVDAKEGAWPAKGQLRLDGLTFGHLGGFEGERGPETRKQGIKSWDNWARLDPDYSPASYAQLATAFTNSGDRDAADDIRYLGRERQREAACGGTWPRASCFLQTVLGSVAGYGIGTYTFKVVPWVFVFWLAGAALLWCTVPAAKHNGAIWCCCASLAQLLPVITINKELTEFFNDPGRARLKGWQVFVFSALGLVGLALGTILLVAVFGLTHIS